MSGTSGIEEKPTLTEVTRRVNLTYRAISQEPPDMKSNAAAFVPQPRSYPLVGNAPSLDHETPIQSMMQLAQELGPVYRLQFPSQTVLVLGEHALVDEVCDESRFE